MFADIHSHILPDIDDGPKTVGDSVELLNAAVKDGIDRIVATPHFYASRHGLEERVSLAENRFAMLNAEIKAKQIPVELLLGFEVRYFEGISHAEGIDKLCLNGSKALLLELGSIDITDTVTDEILELGYMGYTVILAHIERYAKMSGFKNIKKLIKKQFVLSQINASSFISGPFVRAANRLLKEGLVSVLSSDMHSVDIRPPELTKGYQAIEKKVGIAKKNAVIHRTDRLFEFIMQ